MVDSQVINSGDRFTLTADPGIPKGTAVACSLEIHADNGYVGTAGFELVVGEVWAVDPIPDGPRQPPLYWAFEDADTSYDQHPVYEWVEINGTGTQLSFPNNDAVLVVNLPTGFGPLLYYGQSYSQISVSADGWIAPGNYTSTNYTNTSLPNSSAPPGALCPNWDDLYPGYGSQGYVYYYHDAANNRFIVEWDSSSYYSSRTTKDKFEVIFYDTTMASPSGDNDIVFQYRSANLYNSSTVGIQDPSRTIGIQSLFDGSYDEGASPIAAGRAIRVTTYEPTGISEPLTPSWLERRSLAIVPNPFSRNARVHWQLGQEAEVALGVFDASGRQVRVLASGRQAAGSHVLTWDGRDDNGGVLARGVYFVRLQTPGSTVNTKTILAR
jgi:hypothetical protein